MSLDILLFGGKNHPHPQQRPAWDTFEVCVLVQLRDGKLVNRLEYRGGAMDEGLSKCFKAGTVVGSSAFTVTNTEVVKIDLERFAIVDRFSHRLFNDLHHVEVIDGHYFVAATGTDSVLEFDESYQLVKRYPVAKDEILGRHGGDADYRRIHNTKPHAAHPNYIGHWDGETWVTNFESRHVESLTSARRYLISKHKIHDGTPAFERIWFTAVNGIVIKLDPRSGNTESYDLTPMTRADRLLGWCRGIAPLSPDEVVVGFSKLRETKARENLKWIGNKLLGQNFVLSLPTRVAHYDLVRGVETWRHDLDQYGMDAVFSIHASRS